jgi:lysophospholipase L1-like esterase
MFGWFAPRCPPNTPGLEGASMTRIICCLAVAGVLLALCLGADQPGDKMPRRIVFLGDSITDGNTYPLLIRQALAEAGRPVPVCINAGVAGDTAAGMRKRLERDVFPHRPTLVTLSAGINDVLHKVKPEDYEKDVRAIAEQLHDRKVSLLILTTTVLGPKHAEADRALAKFNAVLHGVAKDYDCRVAEVNDAMQAARKAGTDLLNDDQVHLTFAGYLVLTRAVLDGLGHKDVAVPKEMKLEPLPGIIRQWQMRPAPDRPLDEKAVADLRPGDDWKRYTLPEKDALANWWLDQERQRGFAVSLAKLVGPAKGAQGFATVEAEKPRQVFFNTGAQLQTIWLNGRRIYKSEGWTGWHAGKERVAARLEAGKNTVVIETGGEFFLSVTDNDDW